jgi:hypothetical protein
MAHKTRTSILMCIGFDNPMRLRRNVYYFTYCGVRFKLIQGHPRLSRDVLLSIAPSRDDRDGQQNIYAAAGEFLSALSWRSGSRIGFQYSGNIGWPPALGLRRAKLHWVGAPQVPYQGHSTGHDIDPIPWIQTAEQRRALAMYREAASSNNVLLEFLLFWQILEISHNKKASEWVNTNWEAMPRSLKPAVADVQKLSLGGRRLGDYLWDDCRSAIAHLQRRSGLRALRFDNLDELTRLAFSTRVVRQLARFYVENVLGLSGHLVLARRYGHGFPEFVERSACDGQAFVHAYPWSAPIAKEPRLNVPRRLTRERIREKLTAKRTSPAPGRAT